MRIASAYPIVSAPAVLVIAAIIPMVLLVAVGMKTYKAKSTVDHITGHLKEICISKWQRRWKVDGETYPGHKAMN